MVRSNTLEEVIHVVGRTCILLGTKNPRLDSFGNVYERISCQMAQWRKHYPEPFQVKPVPFRLLDNINSVKLNLDTKAQLDLAALVWIAVYFMCCSVEYNLATKGSTPFCFQYEVLWIGGQRLNLQTPTYQQLNMATFYIITFNDQEDAVHGEFIGKGKGCTGSNCVYATQVIR